jgi:hypothetical protein
MIRIWSLSEAGEGNLGLACTEDGLLLGRTPLIERHDRRFVVRARVEIKRLLLRAYRTDVAAGRLMSGLATVAAALNADDPCLARIAAVHLRLPDLPDQTARDRMEVEDALIKYARDEGDDDWNPALHPRTGTPPNPGWFAPTDGADSEVSLVQTAQNDDPTIRSDASQDVEEDQRVVLPPGQRNDELGDLLEWIANAKPEDAPAIRAEIQRHYYDKGDTAGGDALSSALNNVLGTGVEYKNRQEILNQIGPFSTADPTDQTTDLLIGAGLLLLSMTPPTAAAESVAAAWDLGWAARGRYFSEQLGANLPSSFKTIDILDDGAVTSIKSVDLNAATYQNGASLLSALLRYISKLADYEGSTLGDITVSADDITSRTLSVAIPKGSISAAQRIAIDTARARAGELGIDLVFTQF